MNSARPVKNETLRTITRSFSTSAGACGRGFGATTPLRMLRILDLHRTVFVQETVVDAGCRRRRRLVRVIEKLDVLRDDHEDAVRTGTGRAQHFVATDLEVVGLKDRRVIVGAREVAPLVAAQERECRRIVAASQRRDVTVENVALQFVEPERRRSGADQREDRQKKQQPFDHVPSSRMTSTMRVRSASSEKRISMRPPPDGPPTMATGGPSRSRM